MSTSSFLLPYLCFCLLTAWHAAALRCYICGQIDPPVSADGDCATQFDYDCSFGRNSSAGVVEEFVCKTTRSKLSEDRYSVTKECMTKDDYDIQFLNRLQGSSYNACYMNAFGLENDEMSYCVCDSQDLCNELPLANQNFLATTSINGAALAAASFPKVTNSNFPALPQTYPSEQSLPEAASLACYVCAESDMVEPGDCSVQHAYDCSQQYFQSGYRVFCLTRLTRLMHSGLYSIEKRCISDREHQQQFYGNPIVFNGCSQAWGGEVAYCICAENLCNQRVLLTRPPSLSTTTPMSLIPNTTTTMTSSTTISTSRPSTTTSRTTTKPSIGIVQQSWTVASANPGQSRHQAVTFEQQKLLQQQQQQMLQQQQQQLLLQQLFNSNRNPGSIFAPDPWTKAKPRKAFQHREMERYVTGGGSVGSASTLLTIVVILMAGLASFCAEP